MVQGPGNGDGPDGPTGIVIELTIYINARPVHWDKPTISFPQVVEEWNKLDPERYVKDDLPGIDWTDKDGKKGILYPSDKPMDVVNELSFTIDGSYLA